MNFLEEKQADRLKILSDLEFQKFHQEIFLCTELLRKKKVSSKHGEIRGQLESLKYGKGIALL